MKKISLLLVFCMLCSLLHISVNAANPSYMPYTYEDFEDGTTGCMKSASAAYTVTEGGYGNSKYSLKVKQSQDYASILYPVTMEVGQKYEISMKIKLIDDIKATTASFMVYFYDSEGNRGYNQHSLGDIVFSKDNWIEFKSTYTMGDSFRVPGVGNIAPSGNEGEFELRIGDGTLSNITGGSAFSYYIDDLYVKPIALAESTVPDKSEEPEPEPEPEPEEPAEYITNGDFSGDFETYWTAANAEVEISDDVPADSEYTNSLHITETGNLGRFEQDIVLEADKTYLLSFYAKGLGAKEGTEVVGSAITPRFLKENGSYDRITDDSLVFSADWTKYEVVFTAEDTYSNFGLITGALGRNRTEYLITGISIKDYAAEADPNEPETGNPDSYATPEIRNVSVDGYIAEGQTITVSCEYLGINERTGMVQLFKKAEDGGWASIMRTELTDAVSYTFTEADAGQEIKLLIVPMDVTGQIGGYRETELGIAADALTITPSFTTGITGEVKAEITVSNMGKDMDAVAILVLLDEDNTCVASGYVHSSTSFNETETVTVSAVNPENKAVKARLYMWEGTSDIDTTMISLRDSIELK